jgi:hypothetical protein
VYQSFIVASSVAMSCKQPNLDGLMNRLGKSRVTQIIVTNEFQQCLKYSYPRLEVEARRHMIDLVRVASNFGGGRRKDASMRPHPFPLPIPPPGPIPTPTPVPPPVPVPVPLGVEGIDVLPMLGATLKELIEFVKISKVKACAGIKRKAMLDLIRDGVTIGSLTHDIVKAIGCVLKKNLVFVNRVASTSMSVVVDKKATAQTVLMWMDASGEIHTDSATLKEAIKTVVVDWGFKKDEDLVKVMTSKMVKTAVKQ